MQTSSSVQAIATGFEDDGVKAEEPVAAPRKAAPAPAPAKPAAPAAPSVPPVFQAANGMSPVIPNAAPAAPVAEPEPEVPAEDPFDNIFKIFNTK